MSKLRFSIIILLFAFQQGVFGQKKPLESSAPVVIEGTQQLKITSSIVPGQEYVLHVNLPGNYSDSNKDYPVMYLLDSQWDFPLVSAIYGEQYYDGFIPEAIVVGITWGGEKPDPNKLRFRDFTPNVMGQPGTYGNADKFLSFIKNELTPFLESKYRVKKNDRTIIGSSLGGLFTLYAMFKETNFFQNYVLTSPATPWDNETIYKVEKEYFDKNKSLPVRLYMAVGELEEVGIFNKWVNTLSSRNYSGLKMETKILENIGHSGTKPEGYTRGIQWAFKKPALALKDAQLKPYAGKYQLGMQTVQFLVEDGNLVAVAGNNKIKLAAETEQDFYVPGSFLLVHFEKDKQNKVSGFQMKQYGGEVSGKKIE